MDKIEKELLFKDLCGRLPYRVIGTDLRHGDSKITEVNTEDGLVYCSDFDEYVKVENCRLYLRPMSSITKEENEELKYVIELGLQALDGEEGHNTVSAAPAAFEIDFYNKHHFDYRGLILMGLALEAPEGMYKVE